MTSLFSQPSTSQTPSNFIARALHEAIAGGEGVQPKDEARFDMKLVFHLLRTATSAEVAEAQAMMKKEFGYDLFTVAGFLLSEDKRTLLGILADKKVFAGDEPDLSGWSLREQFLLREFERANIFPKKQIASTIAEKLVLLTGYIALVSEGFQEYPEIIKAHERRPPDFKDQDLWLLDSLKRGQWPEFVPVTDPSALLAAIEPRVREAADTVENFQRSRIKSDIPTLERFIANLDIVNRFALVYASDLCQNGYMGLAQSPQTFVQRLLNIRSLDSCQAAWNAVFTRFFLVKRAIGVGEFVDHMRKSLEGARPKPA